MSRGGRRAGAGRKPVLSELSRLAIGARCEELWRNEWKAGVKRAVTAATATVAVEWQSVNAIPVAERKRWLRPNAYDDHRDNIEFALREQQKIAASDERDPCRGIRIVPRRPKGRREAIVDQVSEEQSAKRGVLVSRRLVESCWKEFRRVEQAVRTSV